jgi:hypothetical protein
VSVLTGRVKSLLSRRIQAERSLKIHDIEANSLMTNRRRTPRVQDDTFAASGVERDSLLVLTVGGTGTFMKI